MWLWTAARCANINDCFENGISLVGLGFRKLEPVGIDTIANELSASDSDLILLQYSDNLTGVLPAQ